MIEKFELCIYVASPFINDVLHGHLDMKNSNKEFF